MKKILKWIGIIFLVMIGLSMIYGLTINDDDLSQIHESKKIEVYQKFQNDSIKHVSQDPTLAEIIAVDRLKTMLNDPDSYKEDGIDTYYDESMKCWITTINFRAKNAFGGIIRDKQKFMVIIYPKFDKENWKDVTKYEVIPIK